MIYVVSQLRVYLLVALKFMNLRIGFIEGNPFSSEFVTFLFVTRGGGCPIPKLTKCGMGRGIKNTVDSLYLELLSFLCRLKPISLSPRTLSISEKFSSSL